MCVKSAANIVFLGRAFFENDARTCAQLYLPLQGTEVVIMKKGPIFRSPHPGIEPWFIGLQPKKGLNSLQFLYPTFS